MTFAFDSSTWLVFVCFLAGLLYAYFLYRRVYVNAELGRPLSVFLFVLRFLLVFLLLLLSLNPMLKTELNEVQPPIVVVAQDNSNSISIGKDSLFYREAYPEEMKRFVEQLKVDHQVRTYSFGDQLQDSLSFNYTDQITDISSLLDDIYDRYSNRNLGAVVIATDGIYNRGNYPLYGAGKLNAPIYTIALGDTMPKRDALIAEANYNRLSYLGNLFPVEIEVEAQKLEGKQSRIQLLKDGIVLASETIAIDRSSFFKKVNFKIESKEVGLQRFRVEIIPIEGEVTFENNALDLFVDILDSRQKVLVLGHSPHPDLAVIKNSIMQHNQYDVDVEITNDFRGSLDKYGLVIFHQLPNQPADLVMAQQLLKAEIPMLFVSGALSNVGLFNQLNLGMSVRNNASGNTTEASVAWNEDFDLFTMRQIADLHFGLLPPLSAVFGEYRLGSGVKVMGYQSIGTVETNKPLIAFSNVDGTKVGWIAGEGIWRWSMVSKASKQSNSFFEEWMEKIIQYLSVQEDKSYFRIFGKNDLVENEHVLFDAELYNESYELINQPEVEMEIINEQGRSFPFSFTRQANAYRLDAGVFPVGNYNYKATVNLSGKIFEKSGAFSVRPIFLEAIQTRADHRLLFQLAEETGGQIFYPNQLSKLTEQLKNNGQISSIIYTRTKWFQLIDLKWIFFLLLGIAALEWFLRKRNGAY